MVSSINDDGELVKRCYRCEKYLNRDKYWKTQWNRKGYKMCKLCGKKYASVYYKKNKDSVEYVEGWRERHLKRKYGISIEQYNKMFYEQGGKCKICGCMKNKNKRQYFMNVDHCHETGKVRGILCSKCNIILGGANDDVSILYKAIEYIKNEGQLTIHL